MNNSKSDLQFDGYKILDFYFFMNKSAIERHMRDVDIGFNYSYEEIDKNHFSVILVCYINDKKHLPIKIDDNDIPFVINSSIEGTFSLNDSNEKYISNAIAILFPYMRSFISTVTAQSGMMPFILPTINILSLLEQKPIKTEPSNNKN